MRFAKHLHDIGDSFRRRFLDSEDVKDKTVLDEDWHKMEVSLHVFYVHFNQSISFMFMQYIEFGKIT